MDLEELFSRVHELTGKYPSLVKEETEELRRLSDTLCVECSNALYDWGK